MALTLAPLDCLGAAVPLELTLVKGAGGHEGGMGSGGEAACADPVHTHLCTSQGTHPMHMSVRAPGHAHTVHCPRAPGKGGRYVASMGFHWSGRMRKVSPYQFPKMRGAQQETLYSQGHQEGEVGRGRRDHGRQEGRAGAENEKESLRIQSRVSRVQLQDELCPF